MALLLLLLLLLPCSHSCEPSNEGGANYYKCKLSAPGYKLKSLALLWKRVFNTSRFVSKCLLRMNLYQRGMEMICTILKEEIDCVFMTRQGCTSNGGHCDPVVQACEECNHIKEIDEDFYCTTSVNPSAKWNLGICNYATYVEKGGPVVAKANPLKAARGQQQAGKNS